MFVGANAAIYVSAVLARLELALLALVIGWLGMLAVGRAWVFNEKKRSRIAKKLTSDADPDRYPDLRLVALVSAFQVFVIFPLLFWRLSGPGFGPALFGPANGQPAPDWWHWPLFFR